MATPRTVAFHTLGCKLNFSETSSIARTLSDHGYERVDFEAVADGYVEDYEDYARAVNERAPLALRDLLALRSDAEPIDLMRDMDADCPAKPFGGSEDFVFTPDGEGVVWDSANLEHPALFYTHFVSWLYLGSGDRGFSWIADSDEH